MMKQDIIASSAPRYVWPSMCMCMHGGVINELEAVEEEVQVLLCRVLPALGLLGKTLLKVPAKAGFVLEHAQRLSPFPHLTSEEVFMSRWQESNSSEVSKSILQTPEQFMSCCTGQSLSGLNKIWSWRKGFGQKREWVRLHFMVLVVCKCKKNHIILYTALPIYHCFSPIHINI